jgi:hypothetical protein
VGILAGIFTAALLQDLSFTAKTALVSRGHRKLAVAADVCAMLTSSLYLILAASVTMQSGLSFATAAAFAAIAIGGACGTIGGMFAVECLELRLTRMRPISEGIADQRHEGRLWLSSWLSSRARLAGMDGNRTHPGRLNSTPQTVLKTAGLMSRTVH